MKPLISQQEVLTLAFSAFDHATADLINEMKIIAAQERHIRPVFGKLYEAMSDGKYEAFIAEYIKPALAFYVRHSALPDICVKVGNNGSQIPYTAHSNAASDKQREALRSQAMDDANSLLNIAIRHVEENQSLFPEYVKTDNAKNKGVMNGGIYIETQYRK